MYYAHSGAVVVTLVSKSLGIKNGLKGVREIFEVIVVKKPYQNPPLFVFTAVNQALNIMLSALMIMLSHQLPGLRIFLKINLCLSTYAIKCPVATKILPVIKGR